MNGNDKQAAQPATTTVAAQPAAAPGIDRELLRDLIDYAESGKVAEPSMVGRMRVCLDASPGAAAPVDLDVHGLRALDNCINDLSRLIELADDFALDEMHVQSLLTAIESMELRKVASLPAAPGIDLEQFREAVEHWKRDLHDDYKGGHIHDGGEAMRKAEHLLALIDTSPKGVSDATAFYDASAKGFHISETCGPDGKYHAVSKFQTLADLHAFEDARRTLLIAERDRRELQATSAEVGS